MSETVTDNPTFDVPTEALTAGETAVPAVQIGWEITWHDKTATDAENVAAQ